MILHLGLPYWWSNIGGRPLDNDMMEIHKAHQVQPDMDSLGLERPEHRPPNWRPCFSGMVGLYNVIYFRSVRSHRSIGWRCENLVGGLEHIILFHVLGIIIPTDLHIFQRGGHTVRGKKAERIMWWYPDQCIHWLQKVGSMSSMTRPLPTKTISQSSSNARDGWRHQQPCHPPAGTTKPCWIPTGYKPSSQPCIRCHSRPGTPKLMTMQPSLNVNCLPLANSSLPNNQASKDWSS